MKNHLIKSVKLMVVLAVLAIVYTLVDFSFNLPEPVSYQFKVPALTLDSPVILKHDNMMIIVARYSQKFLDSFQPAGRIAKISSSFKAQSELVDQDGYFVILGYGTHLSCPLVIEKNTLKESCSDARYSWTGKSYNSALYDDLKKIDYSFAQNHTILTIN